MISNFAHYRNFVLLIVTVTAFAACGITDPDDGQINSEVDSDVGTEDSGPIDCFEYLPPCPSECVPVQGEPWREEEECLDGLNKEDALCSTTTHIGMGELEMYARRPDGRVFFFPVSVENLFAYGWEEVPREEMLKDDEHSMCD